MFGLDQFGFQALWSPWFLLLMISIIAAYLILTGPLRSRFEGSAPVGAGRITLFISGVIIYYIAQGSPLYLLGHLIFSAHMMSMSLSYLIVPPLILLGIPVWLLRPLLKYKGAGRIWRFLTHPILTLFMFNALFSLYHFPVVFDFIMTHYLIHTIYYILLLFSAFLMWWSIVCPLVEMERLSELRKMGYIFANGVLLTPACALIIFANAPLYGTFSDPHVWAKALGYCVPQDSAFLIGSFAGPDFFAVMPPLEDQQLGGVIMKLMQELIYGIILAFIFFRWYRRENPKQGVDPLPGDSFNEMPVA